MNSQRNCKGDTKNCFDESYTLSLKIGVSTPLGQSAFIAQLSAKTTENEGILPHKLQGFTIRPFPGLVKYVPTFAYHFYLNLPSTFSQAGNGLIVTPCKAREKVNTNLHLSSVPKEERAVVVVFKGHRRRPTRSITMKVTTVLHFRYRMRQYLSLSQKNKCDLLHCVSVLSC